MEQQDLNKLLRERRNLFNELVKLEGNIRVFCRIRPLNQEVCDGRELPLPVFSCANCVLYILDCRKKSESL